MPLVQACPLLEVKVPLGPELYPTAPAATAGSLPTPAFDVLKLAL